MTDLFPGHIASIYVSTGAAVFCRDILGSSIHPKGNVAIVTVRRIKIVVASRYLTKRQNVSVQRENSMKGNTVQMGHSPSIILPTKKGWSSWQVMLPALSATTFRDSSRHSIVRISQVTCSASVVLGTGLANTCLEISFDPSLFFLPKIRQ